MAIYEVNIYAITTFKVEASSPQEAHEIAHNCPIDFSLIKLADAPNVVDYYWSWSDAMGSEVYDEEGNCVLEDW